MFKNIHENRDVMSNQLVKALTLAVGEIKEKELD